MSYCTTEGCPAPNGGNCLEGLSITKCTHYSEIDSIDKEEVKTEILPTTNMEPDEDFAAAEKEQIIELYSGLALEEKECNALMAKFLCHFILLGGLSNSGKTTTLTSLFDLFQQGPFGHFLFAGSRTMAGFESRSHESRIASGRTTQTTARTRNLENHEFLHLKIQQQNDGAKPVNLIFTDISGEYFSSLKDSTEECKKFTIGKRADHFALFLDAKTLCNNKIRSAVRASTIGVLRSLIEADTISVDTSVQVVFSRWDLAEQAVAADAVEAFFESTEKEIIRKCPGMAITFHRVASRPDAGSSLPQGYGLADLLQMWANYSKFFAEGEPKEGFSRLKTNDDREYQKYTYSGVQVKAD